MNFKKICSIFSIVLLLINSIYSSTVLLKQRFNQSCSNLSLSGSMLNATCRTRNGRNSSTSLDLNNCVTNNNGNLERGVNFFNTCYGCNLNGATLSCRCRRRNGTSRDTSLNLGSFISNTNGFLTC